MGECPSDGPLFDRTGCILTYGGEARDIWINYAILVLTLAVSLFRSKDTFTEIPEENLKARWLCVSAVMFFTVCIFQWSLCLCLGCAGISIVWCALAGWMINERKYHQRPGDIGQPTEGRNALDVYEDVTLTAVLAVLIYYATTAAVITTVAHFCALILGTLLSRLVRRLVLASSQMYELGAEGSTEPTG